MLEDFVTIENLTIVFPGGDKPILVQQGNIFLDTLSGVSRQNEQDNLPE